LNSRPYNQVTTASDAAAAAAANLNAALAAESSAIGKA
jgi:hypothetical protein